ncbi:hypothetical protein [Paenibacillus faecalis]|uniref:hypothetical protein n=1 Tax=Paenibacillus faecalis TaxID=2079532 RepID=UPI001F3CF025|nr:hypothetical protein [Paenibacillus faecalis]
MSDNQQPITEKIFEKIEDLWIKYSIFICIGLGILSGVLHYFGFLTNVRTLAGNVVNFASIVVGVTGVFLTLVITLQESPAFSRLKEFFPAFQKSLYLGLKSQISYGLLVVILSIVITALPPAPFKILASIGVCIWFFFFWKMSLGAFYIVKLITDIIVKNFEIPKRKSRR